MNVPDRDGRRATDTAVGRSHGTPVVATLVATVREDRILLVRRAHSPDQGRWAFPGGKIRLGEGIAAAAARELREETGVRAQMLDTFTAVDVFDRDGDGHLRRHFVLVGMLCRWLAGEPRAGDDALQAGWFTLGGLDSLELARSLDVAAIAARAVTRMARFPSERQ